MDKFQCLFSILILNFSYWSVQFCKNPWKSVRIILHSLHFSELLLRFQHDIFLTTEIFIKLDYICDYARFRDEYLARYKILHAHFWPWSKFFEELSALTLKTYIPNLMLLGEYFPIYEILKICHVRFWDKIRLWLDLPHT